ncbi:MAG: hypothetical protein JO160_07690 [Candidatus Eremiobacteraeota bacterium]|nr:hypothetical protein [Candidatus Eremiobacteraeota bacterium]MBV8655914.1 hypothetical protein [Candidatus Eremiobacteraeota bacterium]
MRIAAFENEPEAEAAAIMLEERGYDSKVVTKDESSYEHKVGEFFKGKQRTFDPNALVISGNAEYEPFMRAAQRHYGFVIRGETD